MEFHRNGGRFFSGDIKILYTKILFPNFLYKMNFIMQVPNKHKFFQEIEKINDRFDIFRRIERIERLEQTPTSKFF